MIFKNMNGSLDSYQSSKIICLKKGSAEPIRGGQNLVCTIRTNDTISFKNATLNLGRVLESWLNLGAFKLTFTCGIVTK